MNYSIINDLTRIPAKCISLDEAHFYGLYMLVRMASEVTKGRKYIYSLNSLILNSHFNELKKKY